MNPQRHTQMDPAEMREGSAVRLPPRGTRPGANASSPAMQGRVCARGGAGGRRPLGQATSPAQSLNFLHLSHHGRDRCRTAQPMSSTDSSRVAFAGIRFIISAAMHAA